MLLPKSRTKKSSSAIASDSIFKKGLLLLQDKLYKQAMIELKTALEHNPLAVRPELEKLFIKYETDGSREIALTIGLVLFQVKKEEKLAITLGNYSRQLGNYKQANNLYRQALKINRSSILAFYNLAASMGHVDRYDNEITQLINRFFQIADFVLPEYLHGNRTIAKAKQDIEKKHLEEKNKNIDRLGIEIQKLLKEEENEAAEKLTKKLDKLIAEEEKADYASVAEFMRKRIKISLAANSKQEEQGRLYKDIFNLGNYALHHRDVDLALECFLILKQEKIQFDDLNICLGLASAIKGDKKEAISILTERLLNDRENRLLHINLALLHRRTGNRLLAYKHQIVSAALLEKSLGLIHKSDMVRQADVYFKNDQLDIALKLYKIVAYEFNDMKSWMNIGDIYLIRKRQLEALDTFREIQKRYPDSSLVKNKLKEVHDLICQQADELFQNSKFSQAGVIYERALKLARRPETIEKLISVYKRLNKHQLIPALYEEQQQLNVSEREESRQKKREKLLEEGKEHLRNQDFESAISSLENAFRIQPDKDTFVYLAHIYKGLKRKRMLKDLVERWNQHEATSTKSKSRVTTDRATR